MRNLKFDFSKTKGKIKPMHAVNNGPIHKTSGGQENSNLQYYIDAGIPYARNHDASFCANYGGEHTVDVHAIFPDFDADPTLESSYDFTLTDVYSQVIEKAGAKVFYRLGSKIEHAQKKYGTLPPKDFKKWAVICEHIIRHYTEGWANGFNMDIEYWEIWNEPDLDEDDSTDKRTWGGTEKEFFEFYEISATHLKDKFPHLKIGGPSLCYKIPWMERFLKYITNNKRIPLDFFSWHIYTSNVTEVLEKAGVVRDLLDQYGYTQAESILNEWNYVIDFGPNYIKSIETLITIKGAAFISACMAVSQNSSVDMLMYYDARPSPLNGLFDFYTKRPLKGYYPYKMFNELYKAGIQIECENNIDDIYSIASIDQNKNGTAMITYYTDRENAPCKSFYAKVAGLEDFKVELYLLDENHNIELTKVVESCIDNAFEIEMKPNTVLMLKFK